MLHRSELVTSFIASNAERHAYWSSDAFASLMNEELTEQFVVQCDAKGMYYRSTHGAKLTFDLLASN